MTSHTILLYYTFIKFSRSYRCKKIAGLTCRTKVPCYLIVLNSRAKPHVKQARFFFRNSPFFIFTFLKADRCIEKNARIFIKKIPRLLSGGVIYFTQARWRPLSSSILRGTGPLFLLPERCIRTDDNGAVLSCRYPRSAVTGDAV